MSYATRVNDETGEDWLSGFYGSFKGNPELLGSLEVNVREKLTIFYIGTGFQNVGGAMSFLGIPWGHSWHNIL